VVAAAAGAAAAPGSYAVEVTQLAQAQKNAGAVGFTSSTGALGMSGALTVGGQRVAVAAGDSLAAVRDKINAVQAKSGVRATLVAGRADGGDARLVLTAARPGSAGAFAVDDDPDTAADLGAAPPYDGAAPDPAPDTLAAALGIAAATVPPRDARLVVDGRGGHAPDQHRGRRIPRRHPHPRRARHEPAHRRPAAGQRERRR
jgi:flagellar hook-associated protein 2